MEEPFLISALVGKNGAVMVALLRFGESKKAVQAAAHIELQKRHGRPPRQLRIRRISKAERLFLREPLLASRCKVRVVVQCVRAVRVEARSMRCEVESFIVPEREQATSAELAEVHVRGMTAHLFPSPDWNCRFSPKLVVARPHLERLLRWLA